MKFYGQSLLTEGARGGSNEPIDKILYDRYFTNQKEGKAIECGANDGLFIPTCLVFEEIGWLVCNVEASKINYDKLVKNRPHSTNLFVALSNTNNKEVNIYNYNGDNGGMNGMNVDEAVKRMYGNPSITTCHTNTYDALFGDNDIDLFVLDIEGHEIEALEGINFDRKIPKVICVEHNHVGLNRIKDFLQQKYILDFNDKLNAIFVRK
jgi:FkbM family methyltransferase